ncbi:MAG: polyphosphate kinase 1, partial [Bacteroidota bacterium]
MKEKDFTQDLTESEEQQYLVDRDVSWLSFNYRVLQEALDESVPLLERLKFLAIYSSNLDEFFRVRVSNHRNLVRVGKKTKRKLEYDPEEVLNRVLEIVNEQQEEFSRIFASQLIPELELQNINLLHYSDLNDEQVEYVTTYFNDKMLPFVQPVLLVRKKIRPFLNNAALYLTMILRTKGQRRSRNQYAIVKIPSDHLPRFIELPAPEGQHDLIMLDDVVRYMASWLFPGYNIIDSFSVKLSRDAELYIEDEFSGDLVDKIRRSLIKRNVGPASRFVYDREMPRHLLNFLVESFDLEDFDLLPEGRYHNNFDFFKFPDFGKTWLKNEPLPPLPYRPLEAAPDFYSAIRERDHMVHVPYHSYESVIRFFEEAARDPKVTHIKVVQYRVARKSRIMNALMDAVRAGKQVTVFIEVKA